jgi:hypothetical protein
MKHFLITLSVPLFILLGCGTAMLLLHPSPAPLYFSETELPATHAGEPYAVTIPISGNITRVNRASVVSGKLPEGVEVNMVGVGEGGNISALTVAGTPTIRGTYTFTIRAYTAGDGKNLAQKGDVTYTLVVT